MAAETGRNHSDAEATTIKTVILKKRAGGISPAFCSAHFLL
jgi:hypothetical protein